MATKKKTLDEQSEYIKSLFESAKSRVNDFADDWQRAYDQKKAEATSDVSAFKLSLDTAATKAGEYGAQIKQAYDEAGGIEGIANVTAAKAGELAATAQKTFNEVKESEAAKKAAESAKEAAKVAAETVKATELYKTAEAKIVHLVEEAKTGYANASTSDEGQGAE